MYDLLWRTAVGLTVVLLTFLWKQWCYYYPKSCSTCLFPNGIFRQLTSTTLSFLLLPFTFCFTCLRYLYSLYHAMAYMLCTMQWRTCLVAPLWMEYKKIIKMNESRTWYSNQLTKFDIFIIQSLLAWNTHFLMMRNLSSCVHLMPCNTFTLFLNIFIKCPCLILSYWYLEKYLTISLCKNKVVSQKSQPWQRVFILISLFILLNWLSENWLYY